jgi:hypothetical protein
MSSKLVITLIGPGNESVGRVNLHLEGLPDGYVPLPEVVLTELAAPQIVLGVQINGVPE